MTIQNIQGKNKNYINIICIVSLNVLKYFNGGSERK